MIELYSEELPVRELDRKIDSVLKPKRSLISVYQNPPYNDEPKFFQFTAIISSFSKKSEARIEDKYTVGLSDNYLVAKIKAVCEAFERYSLGSYSKKDLVYGSAKNLNASLNPLEIVSFSKNQLKKETFENFRFGLNAKFWWGKGICLNDLSVAFIPAQLINMPYVFHKERIIRLPITTGAACGGSLGGAIFRGFCENIEREAFMVMYLNKLKCPEINLEKINDADICNHKERFDRYNLQLRTFDISTDAKFKTILSTIIDKTGIGPSVSLGMKCGLNTKECIIGSIHEAQQGRPWLRDELRKSNKYSKIMNKRNYVMSDILERAFFWYKVNKLKNLSFLLKGNKKKIISIKNKEYDVSKKLRACTRFAKNNKLSVYFKDLTPKFLKSHRLFVVRTVMTKIHPMHLDDNFPYYGGERLYELPVKLGYRKKPIGENNLYKFPHPFL